MEITGVIKTYAWGKLGFESEVAQLAKLNVNDFNPDPSTPYSELWMGDHPSGQSKIKSTGESLESFITKNPSELNGGLEKLPFLFKVLSIQKALSIQVHPNKKEAERLHLERPDIYMDSNHKPELAIALTPFTALCGFRPIDEIYKYLTIFKPLSSALGENVIKDLQSEPSPIKVKACYVKLMKLSDNEVAKCVEDISDNYISELNEIGLLETFNKLVEDFPGDLGILSLFFFNVIQLKPGESIFLPANEPHAYLDGNCIECMACSDNVIRAGLTPKYKDVDTLLEMLNYESEPPQKKLFQPVKKDDCLELFIPSVKDFAVCKLHIPTNQSSYVMNNYKFGSILLVLDGERIMKTKKYGIVNVSRGSIVFLPGDSGDIEFDRKTSSNDFMAYIATYNNF